MPLFINLRQQSILNTSKIYLNIDYITSIVEDEDGSFVYMNGDSEPYEVLEKPCDILDIINKDFK